MQITLGNRHEALQGSLYASDTRTFEKNDNIGRSSTGVEEEFGEKETLLKSLTEEAAFWKEKRSHDRTKHQERSQNLLPAGREARALALDRCGGAYVSTVAEMPTEPSREVGASVQLASSTTPCASSGSGDIHNEVEVQSLAATIERKSV
jgi:hypothetical protein